MSAWARWLRFFRQSLSVALVVLACFILALRFSWPWLTQYQDDIEQQLSSRLGVGVTFSDMQLMWRQGGPALSLRDVTLTHHAKPEPHNPESLTAGAVSLSLDELSAEVSLGAWLWHGHQGLVRRLSLRGLELDVARQGDQWQINGFLLPKAPANQPIVVPDWLADTMMLLELDELSVRYHDPALSQPVVLNNVNVKARGDGETLRVGASLVLPSQWGGAGLRVVLDTDPHAPFAEQALKAFVSVDRLSLSPLKTHLPLEQLPEKLAGLVDAKAWLTMSRAGRLSAQLALEVDEVELQAKAGEPAWQADSLRLAGHGYFRQGDWGAIIEPIDVVQSGQIWQAREVSLSYSQAHDPPRLGVMGKLLPLGELSQIARAGAAFLPAKLPLRQALLDWQVSGTVANLATVLSLPSAERDLPALHGFEAKVADIQLLQPDKGVDIRGINGLSRWDPERQQIHFALKSADLHLEMGTLFRRPLRFQRVDVPLIVGFDADTRSGFIAGHGAQWQLAGGKALTDFRLDLAKDQAPYLDLVLNATELDPEYLSDFLPARVMRSQLVSFLDNAVHAGEVSSANVVFRGPLAKPFPYRDGQGQFMADLRTTGAEVKFSPKWPHIKALDAEVLFENQRISAVASTARFEGAAVNQAQFTIEDFQNAELKLVLQADSDAKDLVEFARTGPLKRLLAKPLAPIEVSGPAGLSLDLTIPMGKDAQGQRKPMRLAGAVEAQSTRLRVPAIDFTLERVHGKLHFTEKKIKIDSLRGRHLGQNLRVSLSDLSDRVEIRARADSAEVAPVLKRWVPLLAPEFQGSTAFEALLSLPKKASEKNSGFFRLESELKGARVLLPSPLAKSPTQITRVRVETPLGDQVGRRWNVVWGDQLRAQAWVQQGRLHALGVTLGTQAQGASLSANTVRVRGQSLTEVDVDAWLASIGALQARARSGAQATPPSPDASASPDPALRLDLAFYTPKLRLFSQPVPKTTVVLKGGGSSYSGQFKTPWAQGRYELLRDVGSGELKQVVLDVDALALSDMLEGLSAAAKADGTPPSQSLPDPRLLPRFFANIARLDYNNMHFEQIKLHTQPLRGGLELVALSHQQRGMSGKASGYWLVNGAGQHHSELTLDVGVSDLGHTLAALGFEKAAAEGDGDVSVSVAWPGALYAPNFRAMTGLVDLHLYRGRLLEVEPGFGRLVGLFAFNSLPRRFTLDFKDLLVDGMAYDEILGQVSLGDGKARAKQLMLKGPVGLVSISGLTDYTQERYDQHVVVLPNIGSSLPILTTLASGTGAGVGILLADQLLKGLGFNIDEIGRMEYTITGPWSEPKIESVSTKGAALVERDP